jgi:hypothetical protein
VTAYDAARWSDFSLGQLGASAALLGLVFVGLSINLQHLIRSPQLVNRGGETVVVLGSVLAAASVVIIPDQDRTALGIELLAVAVATFASVALLQRGAGASADEGDGAPRGSLPFRRAVGLGGPLITAVAAGTLLTGRGGGLYLVARRGPRVVHRRARQRLGLADRDPALAGSR